MAKRKLPSRKELKGMIKTLNDMTPQMRSLYEKETKISVEETLGEFEKQCYGLKYLKISDKKNLLKEITKMQEDEIQIVEKANNAKIDDVLKMLQEEIDAYDNEKRLEKEFKEKCDIREKELMQQLKEEGITEEGEGGITIKDFFKYEKRRLEMAVEVAREIGYPFEYTHPMLGKFKA